jgi:hypothetical protein
MVSVKRCAECGGLLPAQTMGRPRSRCEDCSPSRAQEPRRSELLAAVERDIERAPLELRRGGLAELIRECARAMTERPSALMAKELRECLADLAEATPVEKTKDALDELADRRAAARTTAG